MPELIVGEEVYEHSRRHYVGSKPRPVCTGCSESTMVVKVDHGPAFPGWDHVYHEDGTFELVAKKRSHPRYDHIGYWCPRCRMFFPLP